MSAAAAAAVVEPRLRPPPEVAAAYPFEPRVVDATGGARMAVVDEGPRDAPPVVLLHGNPVWGFLWRRFVPPLVAAGHRVVVPDHVGFGRSSKPLDPDYYSLERHVDNLERALDAVGARDVTLVVHDWGGPIGLGWAVRHPERVRRLAIMNTAVFPPRQKRALSRWHAVFASPLGRPLGQNLNLVVESAIRYGVARRERMTPDVLRAYRWPFPTAASRVAPLRFVRMVPDSPDHPTAAALRAIADGLPSLAAKPSVLLWAEDDPVFRPRLVERWTQELPGIRVERFSNAGHFLQEDAHEALVPALLAFLGEAQSA